MAQLGAANDLHNRPLGDLLQLLATQATALVRQEVELAKTELREKKAKAEPAIKLFTIAAVFALVTLSAVTTLLIAVLSYVIPGWVAALVIAILAAAGTAILVQLGRQELRKVGPPILEETVATLKEDLEWVKAQRISIRG
jgi:uncharacterized membrane protein YqjE